MRIESATEPGSPARPNEDYLAFASGGTRPGGSLVLLDGVTPPPDGAGCTHSVPWYVAGLGVSMIELTVSRPDLSLSECLATAIERVAAAHTSACDLSHPLTPHATVVTVRWNPDQIEHLVLSDSALLIEDGEGTVTPVLDDRLDRLRALGPVTEAQRNVEGGFFTAAADPGVVARAVTGRTPRSSVRAVAALTDGAARLVEVFGEHDWSGTFAALRKEGPAALIARVRAAEAADPAGSRFPRGKTSDDATAALVDFGDR
jgi:Protein phosphatase 2C